MRAASTLHSTPQTRPPQPGGPSRGASRGGRKTDPRVRGACGARKPASLPTPPRAGRAPSAAPGACLRAAPRARAPWSSAPVQAGLGLGLGPLTFPRLGTGRVGLGGPGGAAERVLRALLQLCVELLGGVVHTSTCEGTRTERTGQGIRKAEPGPYGTRTNEPGREARGARGGGSEAEAARRVGGGLDLLGVEGDLRRASALPGTREARGRGAQGRKEAPL